MSDWTHGYVSELGYTVGYYRELSPHLLNFILLLKKVRPPSLEGGFNYCELGCGQGLSANVLAATNPGGRFWAVDFNPTHVANARSMAQDAGLENINFIEKSFAELGSEKLPELDYVTAHGVYSWVSGENRKHMVNFIRDRLKPGGVAYISYNSLPGWAASMPLRELIIRRATSQSGPLPARIDESIAFAKRLKEMNARFFTNNPRAGDLLGDIANRDRHYLAHEYFNRDWTNFYHADVVAEMSEAKLSYVGSVFRPDDLNPLTIPPDVNTLLAEIGDPTFRETVRDFCVNRQFRTDVYVRGPVGLANREHVERLMSQRFVLLIDPTEVPKRGNFTLGEVAFSEEVFNPVVTALASGPKTIGEMMADPDVAKMGLSTVMEVLTLLFVMNNAVPTAATTTEEMRKRAASLNAVIEENSNRGQEIDYQVTPVAAGAVGCNLVNRLFLKAKREGLELPSFVWGELRSRELRLVNKEGKPIQSDEENLSELQRMADLFAENPVRSYTRLGLL